MILYHYKGEVSSDLLMHIVENAPRFEEVMRSSVEAFGGKVIKCGVLASSGEPIGFLEFPDETSARAWKTYYYAQEGVQKCTLQRLHDINNLAAIKGKIASCSEAASVHRL